MGQDAKALDAAAREHAASVPLETIDVSDPELFRTDTALHYFERLRRDDPVHYCPSSPYGPYWSVTRYQDVLAVDTDHATYSSDVRRGGFLIADMDPAFMLPAFIGLDPPEHDAQRKTVSPIVATENLARLEPLIRKRAQGLLDALPRGETLDWVPAVSIELTTQMLATLFDFPWEDRHKLTRWSEVAAGQPGGGAFNSEEERRAELMECLAYFTELWNDRAKRPGGGDLISLMAHSEATRGMAPMEYLANLMLLIVGGNDTTRNTISGSVLALHEHPAEWAKLRANPDLIPSMVSESVRWQTPLAHMRRTAVRDADLGGKRIRAGDKVVMWYLSANRDETAIPTPERYIVDRDRPRQHMAYGFGIHRCIGNRLAELQLRILWEEILQRFARIEVVAEPRRVYSNFVRGFESLPVMLS